MSRRTRYSTSGSPGLPPLPPWLLRVLGALLALWVGEMILVNFVLTDSGLLYRLLAFLPAPDLTVLVQPITRYLVQGPNLFSVLLDLLIMAFFLPWLFDRFSKRQVVTAAIFVTAGCAAAGLLWWFLAQGAHSAGLAASRGWLSVPALGWHPLVLAMVVIYALAIPDALINLFFVLPLKARWILWISIGFAVLGFLSAPSTPSFERFGAIAGACAWFFSVGPGAQRRRFRRAGRQIENDLGLKVYSGGRSRQGRQQSGDDTFH